MIETQNEFGVLAAQNERSSNLRGAPNLRKQNQQKKVLKEMSKNKTLIVDQDKLFDHKFQGINLNKILKKLLSMD